MGFGTPVVSYAPLPMLQIDDVLVVSIILTDCAKWKVSSYFNVCCRKALTNVMLRMQGFHVRIDSQYPNMAIRLETNDCLSKAGQNTDIRKISVVVAKTIVSGMQAGVDFNIDAVICSVR